METGLKGFSRFHLDYAPSTSWQQPSSLLYASFRFWNQQEGLKGYFVSSADLLLGGRRGSIESSTRQKSLGCRITCFSRPLLCHLPPLSASVVL